MSEWQIQCEECDNESVIIGYVEPEFCPVCGRRADVQPLEYENT